MNELEKLNAGRSELAYWRKGIVSTRKGLRVAAALVLSELKDVGSFSALLKMAKDRDHEISHYARVALRRLGLNNPRMVPIWSIALRNEDHNRRREAMERLEGLHAGSERIRYWRSSLLDNRKESRIAAALILAELKDADSLGIY